MSAVLTDIAGPCYYGVTISVIQSNLPPEFILSGGSLFTTLGATVVLPDMYMNGTWSEVLQARADPEGDPISVIVVPVDPAASFLSVDAINNVLALNPTTFAHQGLKSFDIKLFDGISYSSIYRLTVNVINRPPMYVSTLFAGYDPVEIHLN